MATANLGGFCHGQAWSTLRGRQPRPSREERRIGLKSELSNGGLTSSRKPGFRKELKNERKAVTSRYYQLLTGHTLIAPFLKVKLKKTDSDQCWCETDKRQTRDHLFKECGRWKTDINMLWTTIGKKLGWKPLGTRRYPSCSGRRRQRRRFCSS